MAKDISDLDLQKQMKSPMRSVKEQKLRAKNVITFEMEGTTIPHEITVDSDGARVLLKARSGRDRRDRRLQGPFRIGTWRR
jgi:hypothetical protein